MRFRFQIDKFNYVIQYTSFHLEVCWWFLPKGSGQYDFAVTMWEELIRSGTVKNITAIFKIKEK